VQLEDGFRRSDYMIPPRPPPRHPSPASMWRGRRGLAFQQRRRSEVAMIGTSIARVSRIRQLRRGGSEVNPTRWSASIEAMKVMNEIKAEAKGVVSEILV